MTKAFIIFSGFNQRAVIAFLRTLTQHQIPYAIIALNRDDPIFLTAYAEKVAVVRQVKALELKSILEDIKAAQSKIAADSYVLAPSTEALNRFLLDNQGEFEAANCEIPLVEKTLYETISDKLSFGQLCAENNILIPVEYDELTTANVPFVAKPRKYYSSTGEALIPLLILNKTDKERLEADHEPLDFYFQKFIGGQSYYLLYYFHKNGRFAKLSQINLIQQSEGKSIIAAETTDFHQTEESSKYERLFQRLKFWGLVMVEVKQEGQSNYMIEANPRFWGPSQLFVDAGLNLFESFLHDCGFAVGMPKTDTIKSAKYFWYGGYQQTINSGEQVSYHGYSPEQFVNEKQDWLAADVYNRDDTQQLFESEVGDKYDSQR